MTKKVNLLEVVKAADGLSPYVFGATRTMRDEQGRPIEVKEGIGLSFKDLFTNFFNTVRIPKKPDETPEQYNENVKAFFSPAKKVAEAKADTDFTDEEIGQLKEIILQSGHPTIVYDGFLKLLK